MARTSSKGERDEEDVSGGRRGRGCSGGSGTEPRGADQGGEADDPGGEAKPAMHTTQGVVKSMDATSLVVTDKGKKDLTFVVDASTKKEGDVGGRIRPCTSPTRTTPASTSRPTSRRRPPSPRRPPRSSDLQRWRSQPGVRQLRYLATAGTGPRPPQGPRSGRFGCLPPARRLADPAVSACRNPGSDADAATIPTIFQNCRLFLRQAGAILRGRRSGAGRSANLVGQDLEVRQPGAAERGRDGHVGGVEPGRDQHPADARTGCGVRRTSTTDPPGRPRTRR